MKRIIFLIALALLLTACKANKPVTSSEFKDIMRDNDYYIENSLSQFSDYNYIKEAYIAKKAGKDFQVEFYKLENDEYAVSFYNINKEMFEAEKTNNSIYTEKDNKYILTTEDEYKVLSKIENTVIYVDANKKYKGEINKILKKLGY